MKRKKKEEENTILYQQYQELNDTDTEEEYDEEQEEFNDNEFDDKKERIKNFVVFGLLVGFAGLLTFLLLSRTIYRDTTQVVYKDTGSSNRIVKSGVGRISSEIDNSAGDYEEGEMEEITEATEVSGMVDLYELAVAEGFSGTREEFYEMLTKWNISEKELQKNIDELKTIVGNIENGKDGKDGRAGNDGKSAYEIAVENGSAKGMSESEWTKNLKGQEGKDGAAGKSAYEIAVENGSAKGMTESEWLQSLKGKDGAFSGFSVVSVDNTVMFFKEDQ